MKRALKGKYEILISQVMLNLLLIGKVYETRFFVFCFVFFCLVIIIIYCLIKVDFQL